MKVMTASQHTARRLPRRVRVEPYLYLLPAALFVAVFLIYPAVATTAISFTRWDGLTAPTFIGADNYMRFLGDPAFRTSLVNTLVWVIGTLLFPVLIGLGMAILINRVPLEGLYKFLFYLPYAISATATGVIWAFMLSPNGVLNSTLGALGLDALARSWLIAPPWNTLAMLMVYTWQSTGTNMVLFLIGLQSIPTEPVEAAKLDGANAWQTLRHIVFPLLRPITVVVITIAIVNSFKVFDLIWVMTQGGPYRSSETLAVTMYREAFVLFQLGYGAAIAVLLSLIVFGFTATYLRSMFGEEGAR
jgi:ABC-type sugar transport system permease subunit